MSNKNHISFENKIDEILRLIEIKLQEIINSIIKWTIQSIRIIYKLSKLLLFILLPLILIQILGWGMLGMLGVSFIILSLICKIILGYIIYSILITKDIIVVKNIKGENKDQTSNNRFKIYYLGVLMYTIVFLLYYFYMNNYTISDNWLINFVCNIVGFIAGLIKPLSDQLFS